MTRPSVVTNADVALLRSLARERSVVAASRRVGMSRDRAVYRIARLERAFGGRVVRGVRGGRAHGGSQLTELGDRIVRGGFDSIELLEARPLVRPATPNRVHGTYRRSPEPGLSIDGGPRLRVAFPAGDGDRVTALLDPEAILVARQRFPTSARNVLPATVEAVGGPPGALGRSLTVRTGRLRLKVAVTDATVRQLKLRRGARVQLYVKATAIRRVAGARP
ncbi:MAG TPA: TOBE domain-containing protein [Thermoplasmata archaeon]|nr:TOBE domain-containing protein [Thermoplasmata archaeon]